jgi:hypothetical protein
MMRKVIAATTTAIALAVAGPALAGGGFSADVSAATKAGNSGTIGSGAYSKNFFGKAYSIGKSGVSGSSYSTICGGCEAFTTTKFDSVSMTETYNPGGKGYSEAYGFNEADWKTNVKKSGSLSFDWGGYGF